MGIRDTATERSYLDRLRDRVRSALSGSAAPADADDASEDDADERVDAPGNLFQCSTCGTVYIAAEKRVCPSCETEVERVRSTLACRTPAHSSADDVDSDSEVDVDSVALSGPGPNS